MRTLLLIKEHPDINEDFINLEPSIMKLFKKKKA